MHKGLEQTLNRLSELVTDYVTTNYRQKLLHLIELARQAKDKRNENVHGIWSEMFEVDSREFRRVSRSRYDKDRPNHSVKWDITTPTIEELDQIGKELNSIATKLYELLRTVFDLDELTPKFRVDKGP